MTQDVHQGQFTITTEDPISQMPYSDRFTWAKYGHFILYSGLIPNKNTTVAGVHKESLIANVLSRNFGLTLMALHPLS
jgi:hypothetical protein